MKDWKTDWKSDNAEMMASFKDGKPNMSAGFKDKDLGETKASWKDGKGSMSWSGKGGKASWKDGRAKASWGKK